MTNKHWAPPLLLCLILGLCSGCINNYRKSRAWAAGQRSYLTENYEQAEASFKKVLQLDPMHPGAIRQLGFIYCRCGRLPEAYAYLKKAVELDPNNLGTRTEFGVLNLLLRNSKAAAEEAKFVLTKQATNEEAILLQAQSATTSNAVQEIREQIVTAIRAGPDLPAYHLALATFLTRQGDSAAAKKEVQRACALNPKSPMANASMALLLAQEKQTNEATRYFKLASDLSPVRSPRRIQYANFKLQTGQLEEGTKILAGLTNQAPDFLPAYNCLAQVAFGRREFSRCEEILEKVLQRDHANLDALLLLGNARLSRRDWPAALEIFSRTLSLYDRSAEGLLGYARAQLMLGERARAISALNQALVVQPYMPEAVLLLSELNLQKGDALSAIADLSTLIKRQPGLPQAYLLLASSHAARKDYAAAQDVYSRIEQIFPASPEYPFLSASLLARQERFEEARKFCETSLRLGPYYLPAIELLIDMDLAEHNFRTALERAQQFASSQTNAAEPKLLAAKVYLAQTNYSAAEEALLKTIQLNPENTKAYLWLAQLQVNSGRHIQALTRLTSLVSRTNEATAYMQIGTIHEYLRHYDLARDAYEKLLEAHPKFSPALNNLAYLYCDKLNIPAKALPLAERARQLLPYSPLPADTLGWVLFRQKEYPRAFGLIQEAAAKLPEEPEIQFHLGMTAYMLCEEEVSRAAFIRARQATNDISMVTEVTNRLATLDLDPHTASLQRVHEVLQERPSDPIALVREAAIHERERNYGKALEIYSSLLRAVPQSSNLKLKIAAIHAGPLHDPAKALEYAKSAHARTPGDPEIMRTLGLLVFQAGDYTWAASLLTDASRKFPNDAELLHTLAWAQYARGQTIDAAKNMRLSVGCSGSTNLMREAERFLLFVEAFDDPSQLDSLRAQMGEVLKSEPSYVPALMLKARSQSLEEDKDAARSTYEAILRKYSEFSPAARELTLINARREVPDANAFDFALHARQAYPGDPEVARAIGILCFRRNDNTRASQYLREAIRMNKKDAEALYYLALCQLRLRSPAEAENLLHQALALPLSPELAQEARQLLRQSKGPQSK